MNTIVFNDRIDQLLYSKGFYYSYAKGPSKSYRSIEKYDGLKYPVMMRNCFSGEIEVGEQSAVILCTALGEVKWKIPFDRFTESFLNEMLLAIKS